MLLKTWHRSLLELSKTALPRPELEVLQLTLTVGEAILMMFSLGFRNGKGREGDLPIGEEGVRMR